MRFLLCAMLLLPTGKVLAACPQAPVRPACIPLAGEFDSPRELERCGLNVQAYARAMLPVMECEGNPQRKAALRADAQAVKEDFEDAADGFLASTPGVPPALPATGGGPAGPGMHTSDLVPPVYVNVGADGRPLSGQGQ